MTELFGVRVRVRGHLRSPSPKISDFENPLDSDSACLFVYAFILDISMGPPEKLWYMIFSKNKIRFSKKIEKIAYSINYRYKW
jgi:hypothetical protein